MSEIESKLSFIGSLIHKQPTKEIAEEAPTMSEANNDVSFLVINAVAKVKGDIISDGDVVIDGQLEGNINARNLKITKNGKVTGLVNVQTASIAGSLEPEINCQERLTIKETGKIKGKVIAKELVVLAGGKLLGTIDEPTSTITEPKHLSSIFTSKN